jgi:ATP-binding cassette subfamily C (CFTR/MRP) protein 4
MIAFDKLLHVHGFVYYSHLAHIPYTSVTLYISNFVVDRTNIEEMQFGLPEWDNVNDSLEYGYSVNGSFTNNTSVQSTLADTLSREMCIYIYTAVTVGTILVTLMRSITFFSVCMRASVQLHDSMFRSITRATMYFFNTNPSGKY